MFRKKRIEQAEYDRENLRPVLRCSICNGERVAGFKNIHVSYRQRYGLGNLVAWLKHKKPMGNVSWPYISESVSKNWALNCEERELADYIIIYAEK